MNSEANTTALSVNKVCVHRKTQICSKRGLLFTTKPKSEFVDVILDLGFCIIALHFIQPGLMAKAPRL